MAQTSGPRHETSASPVSSPQRKRVTTADLMQGAREIIVLHQGEEYLLRITKSGKLILTKQGSLTQPAIDFPPVR